MSLTLRKRATHGFTLVEMLVVIAMTSIISFAVLESIAAFYRFNGYTIAQADQVANARRGVDIMVRDLREMTYADDGTFPLVVRNPNRTGFYSDIDHDNSVEYVEYILASTTLRKFVYNATGSPPVYSTTTPEATTTLSEYVQNIIQNVPVFIYYGADGLPVSASSTVTDIRYIQVSVIVNIDPIRDPGEFMLRSSASLRNLKTYE